jgi:hypothetical protein
MFDLRFQGELLGRFESQAEAQACRDEHYKAYVSHPKLGPLVTIAPSGPIEVWCHGNFVDSFATEAAAEQFIAARMAQAPLRRRAPAQDEEPHYHLVGGAI